MSLYFAHTQGRDLPLPMRVSFVTSVCICIVSALNYYVFMCVWECSSLWVVYVLHLLYNVFRCVHRDIRGRDGEQSVLACLGGKSL